MVHGMGVGMLGWQLGMSGGRTCKGECEGVDEEVKLCKELD